VRELDRPCRARRCRGDVRLVAAAYPWGTERLAETRSGGDPADSPALFLYHYPYPDVLPEATRGKVDLYCTGTRTEDRLALPLYGAIITLSKVRQRYEEGLYAWGTLDVRQCGYRPGRGRAAGSLLRPARSRSSRSDRRRDPERVSSSSPPSFWARPAWYFSYISLSSWNVPNM